MIRSLTLCTLASLVIAADVASATPRTRAAEQAALAVTRAEKRLKQKYRSLTLADKAAVLNFLSKRSGALVDSDTDGLPDIIDGDVNGSGRCDSDSDDDGVLDGDEIENETSPSNGDSDGDGNSDATERSAKGTISAFADPSLTVDSLTFVLSDTTAFEKVTRATLAVGTCVEVEGHFDGTNNVADKVSGDDSCGGKHGGHGGHGSDD